VIFQANPVNQLRKTGNDKKRNKELNKWKTRGAIKQTKTKRKRIK